MMDAKLSAIFFVEVAEVNAECALPADMLTAGLTKRTWISWADAVGIHSE